MDDGYVLFIDRLPLRAEPLDFGARLHDIALPLYVSHPTQRPTLERPPAHWAVDTSLSGPSVTSQQFLLGHYDLKALKQSKPDDRVPSFPRIEYIGESKIGTESVGTAGVSVFEAQFWLCSNLDAFRATPFYLGQHFVGCQVQRKRTLLSRDVLSDAALRIQVDYRPPVLQGGVSTVSVWVPEAGFITLRDTPSNPPAGTSGERPVPIPPPGTEESKS